MVVVLMVGGLLLVVVWCAFATGVLEVCAVSGLISGC